MPTSISVSRGGVTIHKTVLVEKPPVPTVIYAIASTRQEPVSVRVVDEVPDEVPDGAIAVHDDYDGDGWRISGDGSRLEYCRKLLPSETSKTAFFLEAGEAVADRFFVTPSIEDVRPTTVGSAPA